MKPHKMLKEIVQRGVEKAFNNSYFTAFTVADLINDDKFMEKVYGGELICDKKPCPLKFPICSICHSRFYGNPMQRFKYIQQQAIILEGDEQIKFLHERMEK